MVEPVDTRRTRNRARQELPLRTRLEQAARDSRVAAQSAESANERETLLKAARRYEVAAHLDEWLSTPGLQPPA
jgi:hypothetical protein